MSKEERMIVGQSEAMRKLWHDAKKIADSKATIIIRGESGVGKDVLANAIHIHSPRSTKPFIAVNCGGFPESLIETQLFGHEKGSFTGADRAHSGFFEQAEGGTLFLDEIGDMPLTVQVKLLRALENNQIRRVGAAKTTDIDVRVICATHRNLLELVKEGKFREDLYFRLKVATLTLPPLRERKTDIRSLANLFLKAAIIKHGREGKIIDEEVFHTLSRYSWPGNIRELRNVIEIMVILSEDIVIKINEIPKEITEYITENIQLQIPPSLEQFKDEIKKQAIDLEHGFNPANVTDKGINLVAELYRYETFLILTALALAGGVRKRAARILGYSERTLFEKLKKIEGAPRVQTRWEQQKK